MTCAVCLVRHQRDIHEATLSVHKYLRKRIRAALAPVKAGTRGDRVLTHVNGIGRVPKREVQPDATLSVQEYLQLSRKREQKPWD